MLSTWSVPTRAELRHVRRSGGMGGGLMARRNRNAYAAKWSKELTLLIPKGRGFSAQRPLPASRSYMVSPSVGFGRVPPYHVCKSTPTGADLRSVCSLRH